MSSIPQSKNGAQPQAPAPPEVAFNRSTSNGDEPKPPRDLAAYFAQFADEPEKAVIQIVLSSPIFAATVHKQFDAVKSTDFKNPAFAAIYGASGVLAAAKRKATREAIASELRDWQNDGNGNGNRTRADLEAALRFIETAPEIPVSEKTLAIAKTKAKEIKDRREAENPPIDPNEIKREAKEIAREVQEASRPQPERPPAFELFTFKDLAKLPRPQWLIRGVLIEGIASVLSADSGSFKSFVALDMALSISTGRNWQGREVKQGAAVYVAAEGFFTMFDRATAWAQFYGVELPENFHIVKVPVNLADARVVAAFQQCIADIKPKTVVLDTLSQNAVGMVENSNEQMADFIRGMIELGNNIGAHVQVLHHNAKATGQLRGAGAIKSNADALITLDRPENDDKNTVFVRNEKQRGKPFEAFALRGQEIVLPYADEYGDPITSLVFEECGDTVTAKVEKHANTKRAEKTRAELMEVFDRQFDEAVEKGFEGVKVGFWKEAVEDTDAPICSAATFWAYRTKLEKDGTIVQSGTHKGSPVYRRGNVTPTTPTTLNQSNKSEPITASEEYSNNSNSPLGVGVVGVPLAEGQESDNALPEMPKAKKAKKKNAKADSEAYEGTSEEF
jgi:hypothetical protein